MNKIAIHSVPRSGSTWLGSVFDSHPSVAYRYQPLFSYEFKDRINENSSAKVINSFFDEIIKSEDDFINQKHAKNNNLVPNFKKYDIKYIIYKEVRYHHILENMLNKIPDIKIVGLIRNPLGVLNSWFNAHKEFRRDLGWIEEEEWYYASKKNLEKKEEFNGFEKWKEVALLFEKLRNDFPNKFILCTYKDLLLKREEETRRIFNFCNLNYTMQTDNYLNSKYSITSGDAYSVFKEKNKDEQWEKYLNKNIVDKIQKELKNTSLQRYLY